MSISNSTLSGNKAAEYGGAIFAVNNTVTLTGCTFASNTAYDGGAIYDMATLTVSGCTFFSNSASDQGGAIFVDVSASGWQVPTINNSVFSGNTPDSLNIFEFYGSGNTFK